MPMIEPKITIEKESIKIQLEVIAFQAELITLKI
jgi:hypothetical protein